MRLAPWAAAAIPVAAVIATVAVLYSLQQGVLESVPKDERIVGGALIALIAFFAAALSGYWAQLLVHHYAEQVRLREQALSEFNASEELRIAKEVARQRRKDRILLQRSTMTAMDETAGMLERRWREPLTRLTTLLEKMQEYPSVSGVSEAREIAGTLTKGLDDLHGFFRTDGAREAVDLSESIVQTLGLFDDAFASHGIRVETQLEGTPTLPLFRNEIVRVLYSVLQNAMEVLVARRIPLPRIEVDCYETGQFIVIRISDNGGGVEAGVADRIFEPYFTTKPQPYASGLGLYLSRHIVEERMSGELTFDNLSEGACFYLKIGKHQEEETV